MTKPVRPVGRDRGHHHGDGARGLTLEAQEARTNGKTED